MSAGRLPVSLDDRNPTHLAGGRARTPEAPHPFALTREGDRARPGGGAAAGAPTGGHHLLDRLGPLDRWLTALRGVALLGGVGWWVLHPLAPEPRAQLGWLLAAFAATSVLLLAVQLRRPAWVRGLYRAAMVHDLLLIVVLVRLTGGLRSDLYLAFYLWIALHALYFGLPTGIGTAAAAGVLYPVTGIGLPGIEPSDLGLRIGFFLLVGIGMGAVAEQERRERRLIARLDRKLRGQHERLLAAQEHLVRSDRLATVGELAAVLAHELRNPLAGVSGALHVLRAQRSLPAEQQALLDDLQAQVARMDRTLTDLLWHARPPTPQVLVLNVNDVLERSLWFLAQDRGARIRVERHFAPDLPLLRLDAHLLHQAFLNILLNARQAMPDGGQLTVRTRYVQPGPRAAVEVEISDTGPGIRPEHLPHIFQPFFTTRAQGTGLGLSTAARIVAQHGGWIEAASEPGRGATFRIVLPVPAEVAGDVPHGLEAAGR